MHLVKTGQGDRTDAQPSPVVLSSAGLQQTFNKYGTSAAAAGVSGRLADAPGVSDGAWHGGRSLHHGAEVFLRRGIS